MAIKTILTEPNKILRQISKPVVNVGKEEQSLMKDMLETMYHAKGIGLAAIQVGVPKKNLKLKVDFWDLMHCKDIIGSLGGNTYPDKDIPFYRNLEKKRKLKKKCKTILKLYPI